jgi:hypothetical protein
MPLLGGGIFSTDEEDACCIWNDEELCCIHSEDELLGKSTGEVGVMLSEEYESDADEK